MISWQSYVAAHMGYDVEYSQVMTALNDIDTQLSECTDVCDMDRCAVEELSTRLQVLIIALFVTQLKHFV